MRPAQPAEVEGASALDDLLALFPLKIDKQAFVVNCGSPLTADGDDEFLSFKKVDAALGEIRQLAEQGRAALSAVTAERDRLRAEREGKVLVPVEPTIEMIAALGFDGDVALAIGHAAISAEVEQTYRAMLSATLAAKEA